MAAGVEGAVAVCPFLTPAYQQSRNCKKELNYADSRQIAIIPIMIEKDWKASEWLGLITAGLLWIDFRHAERDQETFNKCVQSLEDEIIFNIGNLLTITNPELTDAVDTEVKSDLKQKPGRSFCHAIFGKYLWESGKKCF
nr:PREDICTED: uncharacterized protein LOC106706926 [Latimeria chalumnae]|eukprot:XP_014354029.1 PREDICTED: uncharacterized protein LOC106706926 [Latimeria chalumnae]